MTTTDGFEDDPNEFNPRGPRSKAGLKPDSVFKGTEHDLEVSDDDDD